MAFVSSQSRLSFAREGSFGTTPEAFGGSTGSGSASPRFLGITNSAVPMPDKAVDLKEYNSFGTGRRRFDIVEGRHEYGPATIDFLPTTGELFYYAFGTETVDTSTFTNEVVHTLTTDDKGTLPSGTTTSNAVELPSMTFSCILEGDVNDFRRDFVGGTVDSLNLSLNESGELTASMDLRAHDVEDDDQSSPTLWSQPTSDAEHSDPQPYMFYDRAADVHLGGTFDYSSPTYTSADLGYSGGRTFANIKSFSMSLSNNLKPHYYTNSSEPKKVQKYTTGQPDFSLSMELTPDSNLSSQDEDAVYDMLENGTRGDILIPMQRENKDELHFIFEDAFIRSAPHELNEAGEEITVSVETAIEEFRVVSIDSSSAYNSL